MGIVAMWLHVDKDALERILEKPKWTPDDLARALLSKGLDASDVSELVDEGSDQPHPSWNQALARLVERTSFDVDKAFTGLGAPLSSVVASIPRADPLLQWTRFLACMGSHARCS